LAGRAVQGRDPHTSRPGLRWPAAADTVLMQVQGRSPPGALQGHFGDQSVGKGGLQQLWKVRCAQTCDCVPAQRGGEAPAAKATTAVVGAGRDVVEGSRVLVQERVCIAS